MPDVVTFEEFPKIARLNRVCVISEKIDGTNGQIIITEEGDVQAASRSCLIYPNRDNHGFAAWVRDNKEDLRYYGASATSERPIPTRHLAPKGGAK